MPLIAREVIDDIVARNDIESVIGSYVTLKRAGSNWQGLCPFHSERSPSFTVFPSTQSFYCFGCNAGGGVITFIEKAENLDFVGAVEFLAKRAGVTVAYEGGREEERGIPRQRILDMNLSAARFFRQCLADPAIGGQGLRYLTEVRRLSGATIKHFGLGFAPDSFGMLSDHLRREGYTDEEMVAGFLCGRSQKTGRPYDYFRNRVMFPIIDTSGNVVAFGGRVMDDSKPKYLNSSDTPAFKKSKHLFALNYARSHCAESMILCEGYMDVIALHAAGFENAVATLGTAITQEQARIFAKYTKRVIISYDSDEAGQRAADRAMRFFGEVGMEVRVLKVPDAKDPDEYIRKFGAAAFRRVLDGSQSGFSYKMSAIMARHPLDQPEEKIRAGEEICELIAGYSSGVEREVYLGQAATALQLPQEVLRGQVERIFRKHLRERRSEESRQAQSQARRLGDRINPDAIRDVKATASEEAILGMMLMFPEYREQVAKGKTELSGEDFFTAFGRKVFEEIIRATQAPEGFSPVVLEQALSPEEMGRVQGMEQKRRMLSQNGPEVFHASVEALRGARERREDRENADVLSGIEGILARKARKPKE